MVTADGKHVELRREHGEESDRIETDQWTDKEAG